LAGVALQPMVNGVRTGGAEHQAKEQRGLRRKPRTGSSILCWPLSCGPKSKLRSETGSTAGSMYRESRLSEWWRRACHVRSLAARPASGLVTFTALRGAGEQRSGSHDPA